MNLLFDTHTHYNFNAFKDDWQEAIDRALAAGVSIVNVGAESRTSERAISIAERYPAGVYAAAGLHPIHTYEDVLEEEVKGEKVKFITRAEEFDPDFYRSLANKNPEVVAIGETGLDYFHIKKFSPALKKELKQKQASVFQAQITLAEKLNKPIIVHCRPDKDFDAYRDILEILKGYRICHSRARLPDGQAGGNPGILDYQHLDPRVSPASNAGSPEDDNKGIIHCFQGDIPILHQFLDRGFMIGFNGVITFTDAYERLVQETPLTKIVLETDAPWLAPVPHRGKRNESIYVAEVARKIAAIKNQPFEEVAEITTQNAKKIFKL